MIPRIISAIKAGIADYRYNPDQPPTPADLGPCRCGRDAVIKRSSVYGFVALCECSEGEAVHAWTRTDLRRAWRRHFQFLER